MQRTNFLAASAVGIAASLAGGGLALAQYPAQGASNNNLRLAYGTVSEIIDELDTDPRDYQGHRAAAVRALQAAKTQLYDALKSRQSLMRGQTAGNMSLRYASRAVQDVINSLRSDDHDYSGHRILAINALQGAEAEINKALQVQ